MIERVLVSPETVTVLGYNVKANDPMWIGLDLSRAEPRQQNSLLLAIAGPHDGTDIHLNVPFVHPDDAAAGMKDEGCRYRVRPKMRVGKKWHGKTVSSVAFERWDGKWVIAVETEPASTPLKKEGV